MSSITSLRRKDSMWIYKNPQGLQVLNDELNQRRMKRSSRHRYTTLSPPLSPTPLEPTIHISKINHALLPSLEERPKPVKIAEQTMQQSITNIKSTEEKNIKKLSVVTSSSVQEKKEAIMNRNSAADKQVVGKGRSFGKVVKIASKMTRVASPPVSPTERLISPPARVDLSFERVASPPARMDSPPPERVTSPHTRVASPPERAARATSPPIQTVSTSKSMSTPEKNFLLEAKQKLFTAQQKPNVARKNLPSAPGKKSVSSFISAFETAPPAKPPRHVPSSVSTSLKTAVETVIPTTSCSSVIPTESYFSEVIDRRFSPTPAETEEEPIVVYLPQLSPDMSFCTNALDIPPDEDQKRPCIKKRVSFSDQLSTFIPDDNDEPVVEDQDAEMKTFVRQLSNELSDVISAVHNPQREKFIPALPTKKEVALPQKKEVVLPQKKEVKEVQPQKLSNRLLDIFQKKSEMMVPASSSKELTHLTKTRARKPPSLKKSTALAYPAAIAQPDWRTRAITTKKSSVFI